MTQALNLANFANNLNTSGATSNTGLQNSSVTVSAGTGMSGGGAVALGSSVTLNNAGVTSVSAGTGISVSGSTGAVTISASGSGTVTSVATGNGLSGGTITTTGTLVIAAPTAASIGAYTVAGSNGGVYTAGSTIAGSSLYYVSFGKNGGSMGGDNQSGCVLFSKSGALSGTWRCMAYQATYDPCGPSSYATLWCRVS